LQPEIEATAASCEWNGYGTSASFFLPCSDAFSFDSGL
jgi:hypothetical protein